MKLLMKVLTLLLFFFCFFLSSSETKSDDSDILIYGMAHRNRAIHGDIVVVELLPQSEWRGRSLNLKDDNDGKNAHIYKDTPKLFTHS